jgi:hypothetical protein
MKKCGFIFLLIITNTLFAYQGQNTKPGFIFPIDGGRKVTPMINSQNGMGFEIGYVTVTSVDSEGALNPVQDQQSVNQLLKKMNQLYLQVYSRYNSNASNAPAPYTPQASSKPPSSSAAPSCEHRRSSKWRQS